MATETTKDQIFLPVEDEPRFILQDEKNDGTRIFHMNHDPHFGLISPQEKHLIFLGVSFATFNPVSMDHVKMLRENDLVVVNSNLNSEYWQTWNPSANYLPENSGGGVYQRLYRVKTLTEDYQGNPLCAFEEAI